LFVHAALIISRRRGLAQRILGFGSVLVWNVAERGCAHSVSRSGLKMLRLVSDIAALLAKQDPLLLENFRRERMGRWARRSEAFTPLQRGSRFDIRQRLVV
jgi:hypothetical protein